MEKLVLAFLLAPLLALSTACRPADPEQVEIPGYDVLSGTIQKLDDGSLNGNGLLRFQQPLESSFSTMHLDLLLSLNDRGSTVTIYSFAKDTYLRDGIRLTFSRDQLDNLVAAIQIGSDSYRITSTAMTAAPVAGLGLTLEISNDAGVRVLAKLADGTTLFDTAKSSDIDSPIDSTPVQGTLVGLRLGNASVMKVKY